MIFCYILILAILIAIIYVVYKCDRDIHRAIELYGFMDELTDLAYNYNLKHDDSAMEWFVNKWTYNDFFKSNKSLILEEWFTEEEINKIKS